MSAKEREKRLENLRRRVRTDGMLRQEGSYTKSDVDFVLRLLDEARAQRSSVRIVDASSVPAREVRPSRSRGRGWSDRKV